MSDQSQTALLPCPDMDVVMQEDLLTFVDVRTLKVKHEEQLKYEVCVPGLYVMPVSVICAAPYSGVVEDYWYVFLYKQGSFP